MELFSITQRVIKKKFVNRVDRGTLSSQTEPEDIYIRFLSANPGSSMVVVDRIEGLAFQMETVLNFTARRHIQLILMSSTDCIMVIIDCLEGCAVQTETIIHCATHHAESIRGWGCVDDSPGVSESTAHIAQKPPS